MVSENDENEESPAETDEPSTSPVEDRLGSGRRESADDGSDGADEDAADEEWTADEATPAEGDSAADATADDVETADDAAAEEGAADEAQSTTATAEVESAGNNEDILAALVSFFIPGLGNIITGQTERGAIIFLLYTAWVVVAWGIGFFLIGTIITAVTFGLGFVVQLLIAVVLAPIDLAIHVIAAIDAYKQSEIVDRVTVKVDEVR